jgi:hypothetical protein
MKKIILSITILSILSIDAIAQTRIGLRISPAMCLNRVKDLNNADGVDFSSNGSGMRFSVGPTIDFMFSENAGFTTGLWYMSYRNGLKANSLSGEYTEIVSTQSVQIPLTLKAYTNEIATNLKLYFQMGGQLNFSFYEKFKKSNPDLVGDYDNKYNFFDVALYFGAGVSYKIGESNELFGGLYYNRGLMNLIKNNDTYDYKNAAKYNMDLIGLEAGIRF